MIRLFIPIAIALTTLSTPTVRAEPVTLFAAASLTTVITEAANLFEKETGVKTRLSFASSSTLARQIEAGASADLYFSANVKWMDYLAQTGLIKPETQVRPLSNRLVLIAPRYLSSPPITKIDAKTINEILGDEGLLTMGDPDHVPVGIYGKETLEQLGLWEGLKRRIARADNALAAVALVARGETPLGIIYQTDAIHQDNIDILYRFASPKHPIEYSLAQTRQSGGDNTVKLYDFLISNKGLALFEKYGFVVIRD